MKRVVIVGGGFTGILTAVNIIRISTGTAFSVRLDKPQAPDPQPRTRLTISIVGRGGLPCRGVAYSTRNASHLLNVVARNMSALADQPSHFVEWLSARSDFLDVPPAVLRQQFVPRRVFGDYVANLFLWYSTVIAAEKGIAVEVIEDDAVNITPAEAGFESGPDSATAIVHLAGGGSILADKVVLALGNQPPAAFRIPGLDPADPRYIANPWIGWESLLPAEKDRDVLIIGTGLTMVDSVLSLQDIGWTGKIYGISRNGLLPLSHFKGVEYPDFITGEEKDTSLRALVRIFIRQLREARAKDINPAILVDKLRPHTQRLWQGFTRAEKRSFLRHFRTRWNITRHRIAPSVHERLMNAADTGALEVLRATPLRVEESVPDYSADPGTGTLRVTLGIPSPAGQKERTIEVGAILNCTGPKEDWLSGSGPDDFPNPARQLLRSLAAQGTIAPDEMKMGLSAGPDFAVKDEAGVASPHLFAAGTLLKGTLWETTAVPELRSQAFRLAELLVHQLELDKEPAVARIAESRENVMEYWI